MNFTRSFNSYAFSSVAFWRSLFPLLLAGFGSFAVMHAGLPELRHDWRIPHGPDTVSPWIATFFEGWNPIGIGEPSPYPTFYLIGFLLWPLHGIANAFAITLLIVFATLALACRAGMMIGANAGANRVLEFALGCFAVLNPWVYQKYVAGHLLMIAAYALILALVAETGRERPRNWLVVLLAALSIVQIEFFAVAVVPLIAWTIGTRHYRAFVATVVSAAPIAYGIAASYGQIHGTPFNLTWQSGQSVAPSEAAILGGYQFGYGRAFEGLRLASAAIAVLAVACIPSALRVARERAIVVVTVAAFVLSTGTKGPISTSYAWAVEHFSEIGLFRELYDLIAVIAIGYIVVLARGLAKRRLPSAMLAIAVTSFAIPWIAQPPTTFFVPEKDVAIADLPLNSSERVALLPAFQPISADNRGSGVDPDAFVSTGRSIPLNEAFPTFPIDAALGSLVFDGDARALRGLAVTHVVNRPALKTNFETLRHQWIYARVPRVVCCDESHGLVGNSMLSLAKSTPALATIANEPLGDAVFFGDRTPESLRGFEPTRATIDPRDAWVDARLCFIVRPRWGTAFGGVTTQSTKWLPLPAPARGSSLLAAAEGSLVDDVGNSITRSPTLHWVHLRPDATSVKCLGTCIVVLQAIVPQGEPEQRPASQSSPVDVRFLRPWLATATFPAGTAGTLRLDVRFDQAWRAYAGWHLLAHQRLDTIFNAWALPKTSAETRITFVETTACVQWILELLAVLTIVALSVNAFLADRNSKARR